MKYLLLPIVALGIGTAAVAQTAPASYPPCSKGVTDECVNPSQAPHKAAVKGAKTGAHHHAHHRAAPKKAG